MAGLRKKGNAAKGAATEALDKIKAAPGTSMATLAGIAAAGAGAAAAVHYLRKSPNGVQSFEVVRRDEEWAIMAEGAEGPQKTFSTKKEAVTAARRVATAAAPSSLTIHGTDGTVQATHSYE